jgi:uncharacterized lipoprotein YehR (DUF1307 family)
MKTVVTTCLFLVLVCVRLSALAETDDAYDVSIIQLIAAPKDYAQKKVSVLGFLNIGFESDSIWFHEEDYRRQLFSNGLGIRAKPEIRKRLEKLSGQYVIIEGVVDATYSDAVAVAGFRISLTNITRADAWKVEPSPTPSP